MSDRLVAAAALPRWIPLGLLAGFVGCGTPSSITFRGATLQRAADWEKDGVAAVVYVPPGEKLPEAGTQIGVLWSEKFASPNELQNWIMNLYKTAPIGKWYEERPLRTTACKIGRDGMRDFIAVQTCEQRGSKAVCAEADERLDEMPCPDYGAECFKPLCTERFESREPELQRVLREVVPR